MLKIKVVTAVVLALTSIASSGCSINKPTAIENKSTIKAQELSSPVDKINTANNKVAFKFLSESSKTSPNNNIVISPLSLSTVLALAQNGASGKTKEEMLKALELQGYSDTEINENYKKVIAHFNSLSNIELKMGNSVWVTKDSKISDEFKNTGKSYYDAETNEVDFSKKQTTDIVNKWIDNQTAGKIKKIIDSFDRNTFMVLINTVYFKAKWANQFIPQYTTKQNFTLSDGTTQDVDMMKRTMAAEYYKENKFEAVRLPYEDADFGMYIFLPDKGNTVNEFINEMTLDNWNTWINQFDKGQVTVSIPKFKIEFEQELNGMLKSFGMKTAFTDTADFSKITDKTSLYIDLVKQKCYIDVNESGTEAAAATGLILEGTSMIIGKPIEFTADRPFIYAISDKKTGLLMFMGVVEKP